MIKKNKVFWLKSANYSGARSKSLGGVCIQVKVLQVVVTAKICTRSSRIDVEWLYRRIPCVSQCIADERQVLRLLVVFKICWWMLCFRQELWTSKVFKFDWFAKQVDVKG